jgi:hypothetical protein
MVEIITNGSISRSRETGYPSSLDVQVSQHKTKKAVKKKTCETILTLVSRNFFRTGGGNIFTVDEGRVFSGSGLSEAVFK